MKKLLECGHPKACLSSKAFLLGDSESSCGWCDEIAELKRINQTLRDQIGKTAIVIGEDSTVHIGGGCVIGLMEIGDGCRVEIESLTCTYVDSERIVGAT